MGNIAARVWYLLSAPLRALFATPGSMSRRMLALSVPARVAFLLFLFLILFAVAALAGGYWLTHNPAAWNVWLGNWPWIALLVIAIPLVVYQALRLWLQGESSRFPDIDYAWNAGLAELRKNGLDLTQIPIFLILGTADEAAEKPLFDASKLSLRVRECPKGPAALHWYANPEGIYLAATGTSCLSKLAGLAKAAVTDEQAAPASSARRGAAQAIRGTGIAEGENIRQVIATSGPLPAQSIPDRGNAAPRGNEAANIRGTMVTPGTGTAVVSGLEGSAGPVDKRPILLPKTEAAEQEQRLEYVCRLLRRIRQPLCPINGILTLLSYPMIQRGPREGTEVQQATKRDLAVARRVLKLRCPVTAMVVGLESESGFRELVRRVGRDRASAQRFGKGSGPWTPPLEGRMQALCAHACGQFEDWVYTLFREKGALSKPGNAKLYGLLCKIRRNVQRRLSNILAGAYGCAEDATDEAFLFGGCYFAGTGDTEERQAFVKGVFDKLPDQQEDLAWTRDAIAEDANYRRWAQIGFAADVLLLLTLTGMILYRWYGKG